MGSEPAGGNESSGPDDQPTVVERKGPVPREPVNESPIAPLTSETDTRRDVPTTALDSGISTLETMRAEEVETTRIIIRIGRALGIAALLSLALMGGNVTLRILFAASVVVAIVVGFVVDRRLRDPSQHSEKNMLALAAAAGVAGYLGLLYWGIFSAAQLFPVLGLYFYARRAQLATALVLFVIVAIVQAAAAAVVITGLAPDPGLFRPDLPWTTLLGGHLLIQIGSLSAFLLGRYSHTAARLSIERMHGAIRLAAQREALLNEARQDLDRVLRVGSPGRYTEQTFGSYQLGVVIGHGGMGEVYEAHHIDSGAPAAIKLLPVRGLTDERIVTRFVREMNIVSSLKSPYIVQVFESSHPADPIPYFVMERLQGESLAEILRDDHLSLDDLDQFLREVGEALDVAREAGIVHRDLKPHNLLLNEHENGDVSWKVLDFGVATLSESTGTLTDGNVVGTPHYMAPEQASGQKVDHRADLYSLGAIVYRWLTGQPPYSGRDLSTLLYQVVNVMPKCPSALSGLPLAVDDVIAVALAKAPADRFDNASQLREALKAALSDTRSPSLQERAESLLQIHPWSDEPR